jgi:hypothetical protein
MRFHLIDLVVRLEPIEATVDCYTKEAVCRVLLVRSMLLEVVAVTSKAFQTQTCHWKYSCHDLHSASLLCSPTQEGTLIQVVIPYKCTTRCHTIYDMQSLLRTLLCGNAGQAQGVLVNVASLRTPLPNY